MLDGRHCWKSSLKNLRARIRTPGLLPVDSEGESLGRHSRRFFNNFIEETRSEIFKESLLLCCFMCVSSVVASPTSVKLGILVDMEMTHLAQPMLPNTPPR